MPQHHGDGAADHFADPVSAGADAAAHAEAATLINRKKERP
jgi:hypothetical protein